MKKIILLGAFAIIANTSFAQLFISGGLGFNTRSYKSTTNSNTSEGDKYLSFSLSPRVGYYFSKKILAGLDVSYSSYRVKYAGGSDKQTTRGFGAGAFVRYVHKFNEYFGVWGEFNNSFNTDKTKFNDDDRSKNFSINTNLSPGILVFAGKNLSFEFSYGAVGNAYNRTTNLNSIVEYYETSNQFGIDLTPSSARFAVNYTF